ncbi:putative phytosulfokine [Helianthus annuus]|uniref:Phytosulfokine n=1 Tax=Helianthus annuus TaxID=4232 RepID=A0A251V6K5_HELAN|nr:putative phytosulfokine [Helianthus annuus]KAJ0592851.1 putative phytosulfokine [Helianthus annuus]KAJ0600531.1 putative phytosulfokine [Helianthus annuus]KAJ0607853.1 putative phytosulfokine [Helianthus annuus]KAJ0767917.1 putative phytosulfokine [Helianthus annuus]
MSKPIKLTTLCTIALLLLSSLSYAVARVPPSVGTITPVETHHSDEEINKAYVELNCRDEEEEECLMRRTLVAHLDYIYTQNKQP